MAGSSNKINVTVTENNGLKLKSIRAFFWDLDNTLCCTRLGDGKACRKLSEVLENQFGFTRDESSIATQSFLKSFRRCPDNSQTSLDSWRTYLWREALPPRYKHLAEQIYPKWLQLRCKYLALQTEHIQLLVQLRQAGFLLALITNGPSNAQWEKIKKLKVQQYFDCVLVSSDLPWEKPNPNIFHAACNFLGVKPNECAMIGDKLETDIKGGRLANLGATFWIPLNQADVNITDVAYSPDYVLRTLLDLYKYFPRANANTHGNGSVSSATSSSSSAATSSGIVNQNRRCSQISRSTTTSTCNRDLQQQLSFPLYQHEHDKSEQQQCNRNDALSMKHRHSLPAIECFSSETENSSDSILH